MSTGAALVVGVVLLAVNAFFVGAEFAVISARRSSIEPLAAQGSRRARTVLWAMEHVSLMLACAQLGITVCSTSLGIVAEPAIAHALEGPLHAAGLPVALAHPVAVVIALAIVVYLHVVLGEMVPKNLAVSGPDRAVLWFGPPLVLVARLVSPLITALNWLANHVVRMLGVEPRDEVASAFTAEEVQSIVRRSQDEGLIEDPQGLLTGAIEFSDRTARDVMIPLADLVALPLGCTVEDVERQVARTGYSRYPVVDGTGFPLGYLHLKDVLYADVEDRVRPVPAWRVRTLARVSASDEVEDVLAAMQRSGTHLARVVEDDVDTAEAAAPAASAEPTDPADPAGPAGPTGPADEEGPGPAPTATEHERVAGVVFLEDILEELVGEVRDAMQRRAGR